MMKKILFSLFFTFCFVNQSIGATHSGFLNGKYCLIINPGDTQNATCYWCEGQGGSTAPGNCKKGYPSCMHQDEKYIHVGERVDNYECRYEGYCEVSCSGGRWYTTGNGYDEFQEKSGCLCDSYTSTTTYRCSAGYYGTGKNCSRCPAVDDTVSPIVYGNSLPSEGNESITDCYISGIAGEYFYDKTGTFEIYTSRCNYSN